MHIHIYIYVYVGQSQMICFPDSLRTIDAMPWVCRGMPNCMPWHMPWLACRPGSMMGWQEWRGGWEGRGMVLGSTRISVICLREYVCCSGKQTVSIKQHCLLLICWHTCMYVDILCISIYIYIYMNIISLYIHSYMSYTFVYICICLCIYIYTYVPL